MMFYFKFYTFTIINNVNTGYSNCKSYGEREGHERGTRGAREVHERCTRGPQEGHERGTRGALSWAVKGSQYFLF